MSTTATSTATATSASASATSSNRATPQGGVLEGLNPIAYNPSNPIQLFIVQAAIIIIFCRLLHYPLRYLGQPRVIAEVIGGILLGPSVFMRIHGFQENIFPTASMPIINNIANLGLILFLFLTGLEVDLRVFLRIWRSAVSVAIASMVLPFGLGYAIAWGLFHEFERDVSSQPISFGVFGLFIGTALAITAFPVLCRILTELKLLGNIVGVTALAAGVGNDVVGWILLALCVSLANNSSGLAALWALLCVVGWALFLVFAVRPLFIRILRRNGSLTNGPSESMVGLTLLLVLTSAWFTGIIGVHPIFGGFLVGLICPHDGGFTVKLTEKIEDFLSVFFLPLYFALSGLNTDLGLLNRGITWAYVVGVISVAFAGKFIGGTLAARLTGMFWRESCSIGILMSCKGLVELIVLNIGLQADILTRETFTIFVVMALVTTVATTPLTKLVYPLSYQQKTEKFRRGEIDWDGHPTAGSGPTAGVHSFETLQQSEVRRLLVYLRLDSLPGLFTFISVLGGADAAASRTSSDSSATESGVTTIAEVEKDNDNEDDNNKNNNNNNTAKHRPDQPPHRHLEVHGIRLLELTERTSSVMQIIEADEFARNDPVVKTFRTFSQLHDVAVSGQVAVVPAASFSETLASEAEEMSSDFALIPWGEQGLVNEDASALSAATTASSAAATRFEDRTHLDFVRSALDNAVCNTGIFIDNGFGTVSPAPSSSAAATAAAAAGGPSSPSAQPGSRPPLMSRSISFMSTHSFREPAALPVVNKSHRIFFPFFGGVDDRVALRFVLQLAKNKNIVVTIAHFTPASRDSAEYAPPSSGAGAAALPAGKDKAAALALDSEPSAQDLGLLSSLQSSLPAKLAARVRFTAFSVSAHAALDEALAQAALAVGQDAKNAGDIIVLGRRHIRFGDTVVAAGTAAVGSPGGGLGEPTSASLAGASGLERTIGVAGARIVHAKVKASVLVVQAGGSGLEW